MEAQYNIAVAYATHAHICLGGVEAAAEYAVVHLRASAAQGFAAAQNNLAVCMSTGKGCTLDLNQVGEK